MNRKLLTASGSCFNEILPYRLVVNRNQEKEKPIVGKDCPVDWLSFIHHAGLNLWKTTITLK